MSVSPTFPGVYIEEIPSGVRTITGVATSIAAFVGRTVRGPVNDPQIINSFGDYERIFGGLWTDGTVSYAVRDFYLNGGGRAVVVRLANGAVKAKLTLSKSFVLEAVDEGSWGNKLRARVDHDGIAEADQTAFNLTVRHMATGASERFDGVSVDPASERRLGAILQRRSRLVRLAGALPPTRPEPTDAALLVEAADTKNKQAAADAKSELARPPFDSPRRSVGVPDPDKDLDGIPLKSADFIDAGPKSGLYALENVDLFNLLCIPPFLAGGDIDYGALLPAAAAYCAKRRAVLLVDPPSDWSDKDQARKGIRGDAGPTPVQLPSSNAAIFFPRLRQPDPMDEGQGVEFAPCGAVAGVIARTDAERGVWKAPAGMAATLRGVAGLSVKLTDEENGELNPLGVNCLRSFPVTGTVVWGARTMAGADLLADEYKYLPVRRLALYVEESLYRGTQWVVFEPNDESLWAQIRLNVGAFMQTLFRQGAFQGSSAREAYFVKCDRETTTQDDINRGVVNIVVGFAPLKPAEFVVISIQQIAGDIAT